MRKYLYITTAVLGLAATGAMADLTTQEIVDMFPGAQKIEIQRGLTTTKVEVTMVAREPVEPHFETLLACGFRDGPA